MKRTLKRELKALEIVEREANGIGYGRREIISGGFRCPRVGGRKLPISGSESPWVRSARRSARVGSIHRREEERGRAGFVLPTRSFGTVRRVEETNVRPRAEVGHPSPFGRGGGPSSR